jgi:eukaryotic-like serine/threonine-protein kinase
VTRSDLIFDERYRLDERIAAGGVGQVWRATDLLLQRPVAVKVLRPEYADHPDTLDRFRKEARHAGALSHPHVAQVYDYGPAGPGGSPYLVMEFVDGPSLADILAVDPLEPAVALDVIAQAADGLSAAHRAGLVHRDVKPANILIGPEWRVKVTDFGISYAAGQTPVTGPGLVMGTTLYMAPERIAGGPGSPASDLYALGIVLFECLTGVAPYEGTPADVLAAHLYLPLPPLPADVPPELDSLVARLTVKDPARRISGAREVSDMAAGLRDAIATGRLAPPARAAARSGPAAAAAQDPVAQISAWAAGLTSGWTGSNLAQGAAAEVGPADAAGLSDGWTIPPYTSRPTRLTPQALSRLAQAGPPQRPRRRRAGALAAGAVLLAVGGLAGLLFSGALRTAPSADRTPPGSPTSGVPAIAVPSHRASSASSVPRPVGGAAGTSAAATPGTTSPGARHGGRKPSPTPSAHASASATASTSPAPGSSASSTPGRGSPSGSPSSPPAPTPSTAPSSSPTPTPCVLGICI